VTSERRKWLFLTVGLAALIALLLFLTREREPSYKGKSLSEWTMLRSKPSQDPEVEEAIIQIGTNGIPYYLKWIEYEQPLVKQVYYFYLDKLLRTIKSDKRVWDDNISRAWGAEEAFRTLGPRAAPAFNELAALATGPRIASTNDAELFVAKRATFALSWLGAPALPPLMNALTNKQNLIPDSAVRGIGRMGSNALPAVPVLMDCTASTNLYLAWLAIRALGELQLEPARVVPVLVTQLNNPDANRRIVAAKALGQFGHKAKSAEPALRERLADSNEDVVDAAATALEQITGQPATNAPAASHQ
jgi:hypothetical protein